MKKVTVKLSQPDGSFTDMMGQALANSEEKTVLRTPLVEKAISTGRLVVVDENPKEEAKPSEPVKQQEVPKEEAKPSEPPKK